MQQGSFLVQRKEGTTSASLAEQAKVDLDTLRALEQGRFAHPSFFSVMSIARILKLSIEELFKKTEELNGEK